MMRRDAGKMLVLGPALTTGLDLRNMQRKLRPGVSSCVLWKDALAHQTRWEKAIVKKQPEHKLDCRRQSGAKAELELGNRFKSPKFACILILPSLLKPLKWICYTHFHWPFPRRPVFSSANLNWDACIPREVVQEWTLGTPRILW